jgi:hypothetical protein
VIHLRAVVAILAASFVFPMAAFAGAWTQPRGDSYLRVTYAWWSTRTRFNADGKKAALEGPGRPERGTEYRDRELRVYGEYGIVDRLTAYGSLAYKRVQLFEPTAIVFGGVLPEATHTTSGIGDVILGGRFRILDGRVPVSVAAEVKAPSGYSPSASPSLGNGMVDAAVRGLVGTSAGWIYATADAGWSHRGGSYQDEFLFSAEIGGQLLSRHYFWRGVLRGRRSLGAMESSDLAVFDPSLASPRALELGLVVGEELVSGVHIEAGLSHILSGRNSLAGNALEVGVTWSRRSH